jgi:predicted lipid-binding transport protein (Tim44 family)
MIGGLAGLLFGSMFANLGFLGDFLGLLINGLAILFLYSAIRKAIHYYRHRRKTPYYNDHNRY